jgi:hypothetical protein
MALYEVKQTLAKQRVVHVEARSKAEAMEKAQAGEGEVVSNPRRFGLLASSAELVSPASTGQEEGPHGGD